MSVKPRVAIASNDECLTRGPNVRFDVSNDGLIPRRLVLELFIVCIGFSFLRFGFGFSGLVVSAGSCVKAERPLKTRHDCTVY